MHVAFNKCLNRQNRGEHRPAAFRLLCRNFVLQYIPVLHQQAIAQAKDVDGDPIRRLAEITKSAVDHHPRVFSENQSWLVLQRRRGIADQIE